MYHLDFSYKLISLTFISRKAPDTVFLKGNYLKNEAEENCFMYIRVSFDDLAY